MSSGKTLHLLLELSKFRAHPAYTTLLAAPAVDTRFGAGKVRSKSGLEAEADILLWAGESRASYRRWFLEHDPDRRKEWILFVDEVQFLDRKAVEELRQAADKYNIRVEAYGIRTDFEGLLFEGSKRMMELADEVKVLQTPCVYCDRPALHNLRLVRTGTQNQRVVLGGDDVYKPVCRPCFEAEMGEKEEDNN